MFYYEFLLSFVGDDGVDGLENSLPPIQKSLFFHVRLIKFSNIKLHSRILNAYNLFYYTYIKHSLL